MLDSELRLQLLQLLIQAVGPKNAVRAASEYEAYIKNGTLPAIENTSSAQSQTASPQTVTQTAAPAQQEQPAPTAALAGKTPDDVNKAFVAYVQKGQGRTAKTAKEIMERHGVPNFKAATPEQCAALCAEYAAA